MKDHEVQTLLNGMKESVEERVERLSAIWGDDHGQIREKLHTDVGNAIRWSHGERAGHYASLLAVEQAGQILRETKRPASGTATTDQLPALLRDVADMVSEDDSAEGFIQYGWSEIPGIYDVSGFVRTGNSMGQGGSIIIDLMRHHAPTDHDGV